MPDTLLSVPLKARHTFPFSALASTDSCSDPISRQDLAVSSTQQNTQTDIILV